MSAIDLRTPLSLRSSFWFPLQSSASRRDLLRGAMFLFVPFVGWLWNMGHRIEFVHRMLRGEAPWPAGTAHRRLLRNGLLTFLGMVFYVAPGTLLARTGVGLDAPLLTGVGVFLQAIAVVAIPGYMSHFCVAFDPREIFNPLRALRRVFEGGASYWHAWGIALVALVLSFVIAFVGWWLLARGCVAVWDDAHPFRSRQSLVAWAVVLLAFFNLTSVWFWQVAGFSFATVFAERFGLRTLAERR